MRLFSGSVCPVLPWLSDHPQFWEGEGTRVGGRDAGRSLRTPGTSGKCCGWVSKGPTRSVRIGEGL